MQEPLLSTTAFGLDGYRVSRHIGLVRGIIVRSRSIVGNIGAALQTLVGGNISIYTNLCERARQDAFEALCEHARAVGANAVIGLRYDATEIAAGVTEVLCYGTAVVVEKINGNKNPAGRSAGRDLGIGNE
jgi:uncharacterized protein YbjQ (UPF0145 family)